MEQPNPLAWVDAILDFDFDECDESELLLIPATEFEDESV